MPKALKNQLIKAFVLFSITMTIGIVGYKLLAGSEHSILDALYMTVITLSTVGYGETIDLTGNPSARIFTMFLILFGMGNILFVVSTLTSFLTDGEIQELLRRRAMEKKIDKLQDHFVVCGAGLTTRHIISELITVKQDFVLVSNNDEQLKSIKEDFKDIFFIQGDPTYNQTLEAAGVGEAKGLITALNDDRDNILVVITAKSLNPNIRIIARATHTESIPKLKSVGAEAIISPTLIGGLRMVSEAIRPSVVSFLDTMLRDKTQTMRVEEFTVEANSSLINKKLAESKIREKTSLLVVALKHPGTEHFIYNPSASEVIQSGTIIILIGNVDNLLKLKEFV